MAIGFEDLKKRLGDIYLGMTFDKQPIYARDLNAENAMAILLKDAINPNLVQTLEGNPAIVHGGPFARDELFRALGALCRGLWLAACLSRAVLSTIGAVLRVDIACAGAALLRELLRMIYSSTAFAGVLLIALQLAARSPWQSCDLPLWSKGRREARLFVLAARRVLRARVNGCFGPNADAATGRKACDARLKVGLKKVHPVQLQGCW